MNTVKKSEDNKNIKVEDNTLEKKPAATTVKKSAEKTKTATSQGSEKAPAKKTVKKGIEVIDNVPIAEAETPAEITVIPKQKILFVASEAAPFIATGGLAEVIGSLSKALAKDDNKDVRVIIPLYQDIKKEFRKDFRFIGNIFVPLSWRNQYCGIFE